MRGGRLTPGLPPPPPPLLVQILHEKQCSQLADLIALISGDLTPGDRKKLVTLCTIDVHARDVVQRLIDDRAEDAQVRSQPAAPPPAAAGKDRLPRFREVRGAAAVLVRRAMPGLAHHGPLLRLPRSPAAGLMRLPRSPAAALLRSAFSGRASCGTTKTRRPRSARCPPGHRALPAAPGQAALVGTGMLVIGTTLWSGPRS
jgi:hypothetical protein